MMNVYAKHPEARDPIHALALEATIDRAAAQDPIELYVVGTILSLDPPRRMLEIGTASAGALWFWSRVANYEAQIASIDVSHHDVHAANVNDIRQECVMFLGDSRSESSLRSVSEFMSGPLDFLFIDGDHSYEVSMSDWLTYSPLVRPGGWVGFHDVQGPYVEDGGSYRTWQEVKQQHPNDLVEICLRKEGGMGIGLVRVS